MTCAQLRFIYRDGYGALADYIIVKESSLFELPDGLSYEKAALVEPFSVALHAVENAGVGVGDTVVIIGDGMHRALYCGWMPDRRSFKG